MNHIDMVAETMIRHQRAETEAHIARRQLLHEAFAGRRGRVTFYRPLLIGVGQRLVTWGTRLQQTEGQPASTWAIENR